MKADLELSIIVLAWNQLDYTKRCIESVRKNTDVPYELIIVDNGSDPEAVSFARGAADRAILNGENLGFAVGMNQGLRAAAGRFVAFVNNDTELPPRWSSMLLSTFDEWPRAGIVLPAVTAAGNPISVRTEPGDATVAIPRFRHLPSGVVYVMNRERALALGGWDERYKVASREDLDLLFTVWVNGFDVVLDERVLVDHASNVTARAQLQDRAEIWRRNGEVFVEKWSNPDTATIDPAEDRDFDRADDLLAQARTAAIWLGRVFAAEDRIEAWKAEVRELKGERRRLRKEIERGQKERDRLLEKLASRQKQPVSIHQRILRKARSLGRSS